MNRSWLNRKLLIVTAIIVVVVIYGSLYPFEFRVPAHGVGAVHTLVASWADRPGRGDFISNILLYLPLGLFGVFVMNDEIGAARRIGLIVLIGAALSASMELTQYYDEGRDTAATDLYSNTIGTALGAIIGFMFGRSVRLPFLEPIYVHRVPVLLLAAWVGYRLYPYVPTIDLHKWWGTLKPIVLTPTLAAYPLFRHTAIGLTIACLIEGIYGPMRGLLAFPVFAGGLLVAQVFIITTTLSLAEIAGAIVAYGVWFALVMAADRRRRMAIVALILCAYVLAERLEPFHFRATAGAFGWIPFQAFMRGSIEVDIVSFCEKVFLYGGLIWLMVEAGLRLRAAAALVALLLLLTSAAEIYLPGRSAEITDAILALMIAATFSLIDAPPKPVVAAPVLAKPTR